MKPGETYLSGELDLGALGKRNILIFKNDYKEANQPDYNIFLNIEGDKPKKCGALWTKVKKEPEPTEEKQERMGFP